MKLEMDLIRDILLWCEENVPSETEYFLVSRLKFPGFTSFQIIHHFKLLIDAGYIEARDNSSLEGRNYVPVSLTMSGYEFLASIKNDTLWKNLKDAGKELGIQAIKSAIPILMGYLAKQAGVP